MNSLDIRTQEKIWKKAELLHCMITTQQVDYSCLVYELLVLIQDYYFRNANNLTIKNFQKTVDHLVSPPHLHKIVPIAPSVISN